MQKHDKLRDEGRALTIEIHTPELEALIIQRMRSGGFQNVEDALLQALKALPGVEESRGATHDNGLEPTSLQVCKLRPTGNWASSLPRCA
jgi:hypothetical protein